MKRNEPKDYDLCRKGNHRAREEKASQRLMLYHRGKSESKDMYVGDDLVPFERNNNNRREATEDYQLEEDHDDDDRTVDTKTGRATHPEAHYKQNYAPFSTTFCFVQCIILLK